MLSRKLLAGFCLLTSGVVAQAATPQQQPRFPTDVQSTNCSVDSATFNSWFGDSSTTAPISSNGKAANAADSTGFPANNTKCDFYKWSAQMFLWLTSPAGQSYVFDTVGFFDVSATDSQGKRALINNTPNSANSFSLRSIKGDEVDASDVDAQITGETGQAGSSDTLISQKQSGVYYGLHVNDIYAYFLSAQKNLNLPKSDFPTTETQMLEVAAYAALQGVVLPDLNAGPMELKTSWVDVDSVTDVSKFLTITAEVPKFKVVDTKNQVALIDGSEVKTLALVGMHIVGTVKGHPEMVWATIEHVNNAPDMSYSYTNENNETATYTMPTSGSWTFAPPTIPSDSSQYNIATVETINENLIATQGYTLSDATTAVQLNPWGSPSLNSSKGTQDPENNSELISLNNDVMGMLEASDRRRNYFLSGAVWTQHGNIPTYSSGGPSFKQIGSISLSNMTMETFTQGTSTDPTKTQEGCFSCHSISGTAAADKQGVDLSHIYGEIQPLKAKK